MSKIKTSCEICIFRKNDENHNQVGCKLNRLQKFINRGEAEKYNNYYHINRFCNTCRSTGTKEEILKEVEISYSVIVYGWNDYWKTLKSLLYQTIKPKTVYVIFDDMKLFDKDKYYEFSEIFKEKGIQLNFKYFFENKNYLEMIDEIVPKLKTQYYTYIKDPISKDFIVPYHKMVNEEMIPFICHVKKEYLNSIILCQFHKVAYGNNKKIITEKIKEYIESNGAHEGVIIDE